MKTATTENDNKSLQKQSRKEYDVFNITEENESDKGVMLLQIAPGNVDTFDVEKATTCVEYETMEEEHLYLTEDLGWKEGLNEEMGEKEFRSDPKYVTKFSEYLFLTKQMCWTKGLKVLGETQSSEIPHVPEGKKRREYKRQRMRQRTVTTTLHQQDQGILHNNSSCYHNIDLHDRCI